MSILGDRFGSLEGKLNQLLDMRGAIEAFLGTGPTNLGTGPTKS